jgi:hypothetical protein
VLVKDCLISELRLKTDSKLKKRYFFNENTSLATPEKHWISLYNLEWKKQDLLLACPISLPTASRMQQEICKNVFFLRKKTPKDGMQMCAGFYLCLVFFFGGGGRNAAITADVVWWRKESGKEKSIFAINFSVQAGILG